MLDGPSPAEGTPLAGPQPARGDAARLLRSLPHRHVLGHIAEEQRQPVGMDIYLSIDRNARPASAPATSHVHANGTTRTSHDGGTS